MMSLPEIHNENSRLVIPPTVRIKAILNKDSNA